MRSDATLPCGCPARAVVSRTVGNYVIRRSMYRPGCTLGVHSHAEDRIVLTLNGQFQSMCNDGSFSLSEAQAMFRPADVGHRDEYDRPTISVAILLDPRDRPRSHAFSYADASLPTLGRRLSAELDVMDDLSPLVIEGLAADVVGRMWSRCRQERTTPSWLFKVRDRIESEYSSPPTLSEIAAMVHRTPSHVATAFRRVFGRSVGEYVRGVRLWRARTLLDDEATSLATIAQRTGFSDQSHFCRIFKRRFGLTPGAYRIRRCLLGRFDHDRPFVPQQ